jgi:plastocyanin
MENNQPQSANTDPTASAPQAPQKRKRIILLLTILIIAIALGSAYTVSRQDNESTNSNQTNVVKKTPTKVTISHSGFSPAAVTINKGETINWTNNDRANHQVVIDTYSGKENYNDFKSSESLSQGAIYGMTFYKVGAYFYHDQLNPELKGTVNVH